MGASIFRLTCTMSTFYGHQLNGEYANIPQWFFDEIERYLKGGLYPGSTTSLILGNAKWMDVATKVQNTDIGELRNMMVFIFNCLPGNVWGSPDAIAAFLETDKRFLTIDDFPDIWSSHIAAVGDPSPVSLATEDPYLLKRSERQIEFGNSDKGDVGAIAYIYDSRSPQAAMNKLRKAVPMSGGRNFIEVALQLDGVKVGHINLYLNCDIIGLNKFSYTFID